MRTTLDIDDELVLMVKQIARQRKTTTGRVVSSLLRDSLELRTFKVEYRNGVPVLQRRPNGTVITAELVNRLIDEDK